MAKTLFAVTAAAFIVACVAGWAAIPTSQARVAEAAPVQVDTFKMMTSAKQMPSEHFVRFYVRVLSDSLPPHSEPRPHRGFFLGPPRTSTRPRYRRYKLGWGATSGRYEGHVWWSHQITTDRET